MSQRIVSVEPKLLPSVRSNRACEHLTLAVLTPRIRNGWTFRQPASGCPCRQKWRSVVFAIGQRVRRIVTGETGTVLEVEPPDERQTIATQNRYTIVWGSDGTSEAWVNENQLE